MCDKQIERAVLPIPGRQHAGWITYDAKDSDTTLFGGLVNTLNIDRPTRNDWREDLAARRTAFSVRALALLMISMGLSVQ
jgi:hypothetical protein